MNKLILIGLIGCKKCYLNITEEMAIKRYCESENLTRQQFEDEENISVETIDFKDEFSAYDI